MTDVGPDNCKQIFFKLQFNWVMLPTVNQGKILHHQSSQLALFRQNLKLACNSLHHYRHNNLEQFVPVQALSFSFRLIGMQHTVLQYMKNTRSTLMFQAKALQSETLGTIVCINILSCLIIWEDSLSSLCKVNKYYIFPFVSIILHFLNCLQQWQDQKSDSIRILAFRGPAPANC